MVCCGSRIIQIPRECRSVLIMTKVIDCPNVLPRPCCDQTSEQNIEYHSQSRKKGGRCGKQLTCRSHAPSNKVEWDLSAIPILGGVRYNVGGGVEGAPQPYLSGQLGLFIFSGDGKTTVEFFDPFTQQTVTEESTVDFGSSSEVAIGAGVGSREHEGGIGEAVNRRLEVQGGWFFLYLVGVECEDSLDLGDRQRMPVGGMSGRNQLLGTGEIEMGAFIGHDAV